MSQANQHIIQKSKVQLNLGPQADAHQLQNRILDIFQNRIMPKMEQVLDGLAGPDVVLNFDRLELSLGALTTSALEAQLEERILACLREEILKALSQQDGAKESSLQKQDPAAHSLQHIIHFLERGTLTWAHAAPSYSLDAAVTALLDSQPKRLIAGLLPVLAEELPRRRFQLQLKPATLAAFLEQIHPAWRQAWERLPGFVAELRGVLPLISPDGEASEKAEIKDFVLELAAADAMDKLLPALRAHARQLHDGHFVAAELAKAWIALQVGVDLAVPQRLPSLAPAALLQDLTRLGYQDTELAFSLLRVLAEADELTAPVVLAEVPAQLAVALLLGKPLPAAVGIRLVRRMQAVVPDFVAGFVRRFPRHETAVLALVAAAAESSQPGLPQTPAFSEAEETSSALPKQKTANTSPEAPDREETPADSLKPARKAKASKLQPPSSPRTPSSSPVTEHYVDHAGLVLLNPFFQHCFDGLGWLAGGDFVDEARREDAVLLLAYIATGEWEHPEGTLSLEKLLCGMPLDQPIRLEVALPDTVLAEAENLIQSAVHYWDKLGKVSTESFRYTFLNREGVLRPSASGWVLKVNRTGVDILMEFMPWGYGIVRLPWMQTILSVDW